MSVRRSLLFVVIGALLGAGAIVNPVTPGVRPDPEFSNFRLMGSGPPGQD